MPRQGHWRVRQSVGTGQQHHDEQDDARPPRYGGGRAETARPPPPEQEDPAAGDDDVGGHDGRLHLPHPLRRGQPGERGLRADQPTAARADQRVGDRQRPEPARPRRPGAAASSSAPAERGGDGHLRGQPTQPARRPTTSTKIAPAERRGGQHDGPPGPAGEIRGEGLGQRAGEHRGQGEQGDAAQYRMPGDGADARRWPVAAARAAAAGRLGSPASTTAATRNETRSIRSATRGPSVTSGWRPASRPTTWPAWLAKADSPNSGSRSGASTASAATATLTLE